MRGSTSGRWDRPETWLERLRAGGLSPSAAERTAVSMATATDRLRAESGNPDFAFFIPGRIEVFGKHTDYAGGQSLLAAMEWGFSFVGRRDPGLDGVHVIDAVSGRVHRTRSRVPSAPAQRGWARYTSTVVRRLIRDAPGVQGGVALAFASDLPPASGMSSSSALVVGTFLGVTAALDLDEAPWLPEAVGCPDRGPEGDVGGRDRLADHLSAIESGGAGTDGGSEDHAAILSARTGRVVRYSFLPTRFQEEVPLPPGWVFVIASSGVRAEKAINARRAYNHLSEETRTAARIWREETGGDEPHLGAILARSGEARLLMEDLLGRAGHDRLLARFRQFATETADLVPGAAAALAACDLQAVGGFAATSQTLADEVLGNQVPETRYLAASAGELGAPAASAFGAGFGGSVWALVPTGYAEGFVTAWRARYLERFPRRAETCGFLSSNPGPAAFRVL